ncbi:M23 family metallopeptidase [Pseudoclavibacter sp. RFBA6]|uniref:M23 family metallopeptidase n=1 Tax=Pseudoclavibacter sp. RFBA6 TaxID=2080573 RepID=UPI000CE7D2E4|nr:M23 family metallopeptidase [Pseudoclavibacter sp. RFBA6]PPG43741.1 M23 family peptidase [Pseudoclavibacter sp. RFBA6]
MAEQDTKRGGTLALLAAPLLAVGLLFPLMLTSSSTMDTCNPTAGSASSVTIDPSSIPNVTIDEYGPDRLINAAYIVQAGKALGLGARDQTIGVMTAIGESSLEVKDYGDAVGPDSRGLFQQRGNGAWGSYEDRMNPTISATNFFKAMLVAVPDVERQTAPPTLVAHRTQGNADPYHYESYWDTAVRIVDTLSGVKTGLATGTGGQACSAAGTLPGQVSKDGWAKPADGPNTDGYGPRSCEGCSSFHRGVDLAPGCDAPIWAAQKGVVTFAGFDSAGNGTIKLDHGGGIGTNYLHMYESGILVREGDTVNAGQQIARVGNTGQSTGCHLHFAVVQNGELIDPAPFMAQFGISLN